MCSARVGSLHIADALRLEESNKKTLATNNSVEYGLIEFHKGGHFVTTKMIKQGGVTWSLENHVEGNDAKQL
jgi:hypothetical protein